MFEMSRNLVVKSNKLIEASYRLSLGEQRIVLFAISEIKKFGGFAALPDGFIYIRATAYAEMFGMPTDQAYEQLKEAGIRIFERYVMIDSWEDEDGEVWFDWVRWVSRGGYQDKKGVIRLKFTEDMQPFIVELESRFTHYNLEFIAKMTSTHAIRLYELLMQWKGRGWREEEIRFLKPMLGLNENTYPSIKDFKKWVVDVAVSQINEFSDITVSYVQRKTGRTVTHFRFDFAEKTQPATPLASTAQSALVERLKSLGIGLKTAREWEKNNPERAAAAAAYVEAKAAQKQIKGSPAGYLRTVFLSGGEIPKTVVPTASAEPLINGVPKSTIDRLANPGETYPQAAARILKKNLA